MYTVSLPTRRNPRTKLTFHHATIRPEVIALYPHPAEPVDVIRSQIRQAIADVWGTDFTSEAATGHQPHLSIAYANKKSGVVTSRRTRIRTHVHPARLFLVSVSCIALQRVNHAYRWDTHATVHLAG